MSKSTDLRGLSRSAEELLETAFMKGVKHGRALEREAQGRKEIVSEERLATVRAGLQACGGDECCSKCPYTFDPDVHDACINKLLRDAREIIAALLGGEG